MPTPRSKPRHPLRSVWTAMRDRCNNPRSAQYAAFGGRGIEVCARWARFAHFVSDMGARPSAHHFLDRRNVNGHYEPSNCLWSLRGATPPRQERSAPDPEYAAALQNLLDGGVSVAEAFRTLGPAKTVKYQHRSTKILKKATHDHVKAARKKR